MLPNDNSVLSTKESLITSQRGPQWEQVLDQVITWQRCLFSQIVRFALRPEDEELT